MSDPKEPTHREITVRFFLDAKTGMPHEVKMHTLFQVGKQKTAEGLPITMAVVWFECSCEEFSETNWCDHADAVDSDFDPETGTLYGEIDNFEDGFDVLPGEDQQEAAERFRQHLLDHSRIEVL